MKKVGFITGVFTLLSLHLNAQEHFQCGADHKMAPVFAAHPELLHEHQQLIANSSQETTNDRGDREQVYVIPVVFHVIHEYGSENISDAQIYDQLDILNRDFRKDNADTSEIVPAFEALAADANIEFKLASLDPFGNCTNGIEHIWSHETRMGDDNSKLNQWPRSRYLNVWVVKTMESGVAGYAYYPSAVSTGLYYADGIIILNQYIGSIGTSDVFSSRALTHEIGHYLGLPHTWGNTNDPTVACGDDGISDTPATKGHNTCILTGTDDCNAGVEENVQNYMEYAYCSRMFTIGQVNVMHASLDDIISSRDNLWTTTNHNVTGIDVTTPLCSPVPDFYADHQLICAGEEVTFNNTSWRAPVDDFSWYFPGGTPEYSTDPNPTVTYGNAGHYDVTLTVSNAGGTETKTFTQYMNVQGDWWHFTGPTAEDFEGTNFDLYWIVENPEFNESKFKLIEGVGYSGDQCVGVQHFKPNQDPILDLNYDARLGGTKDVLISPVYNLDNTAGATLTFKYAHATSSGGQFDPANLNLRVYYTTNCGASWILLENIQELDVITAGYQGGNFMPADLSYWQAAGVNLPGGAMADQVRFKFEFTAADFSNNFFLDDINVTGVLLTEENALNIYGVKVFPNPVSAGQVVNVAYDLLQSGTVTVTVHDMLGNLVATDAFAGIQGTNSSELSISGMQLGTGIYTVTVRTETALQTTRLVVR
jgi:PKD repeat protein